MCTKIIALAKQLKHQIKLAAYTPLLRVCSYKKNLMQAFLRYVGLNKLMINCHINGENIKFLIEQCKKMSKKVTSKHSWLFERHQLFIADK
jgi:hypothetical protein